QEPRATSRSDIYAMGLIVLECLTGETAITGQTPFELLMKHVREPLDMPPYVRGGPFGHVIARACAKNPVERYAHAGEMLQDVERVDPTGAIQSTAPIARDEVFAK